MTEVSRADTLDTLHAVVLFLGLVGIFNYGVAQRWPLLLGVGVLILWTLGYWGVVKWVLPTRWSGQETSVGVRCLRGHDWIEQTVSKGSAYRDGTLVTGLKSVEYKCSQCETERLSLMTPGQLKQARKKGHPPRE